MKKKQVSICEKCWNKKKCFVPLEVRGNIQKCEIQEQTKKGRV